MFFGHTGLYYGAMELDAAIRWEIAQDQEEQQQEDLGSSEWAME